IEIDGHVLSDLDEPHRIVPDISHQLVARAKRKKEYSEKLLLGEGERKVLVLKLEPLEEIVPAPREVAEPKKGPRTRATTAWLGASFQGYFIPKFVMNFAGDGGTNVYVPGAAVGYTTHTGDVDMTLSLGYASYRLGNTPFKPHGTPATEWEFISSDL